MRLSRLKKMSTLPPQPTSSPTIAPCSSSFWDNLQNRPECLPQSSVGRGFEGAIGLMFVFLAFVSYFLYNSWWGEYLCSGKKSDNEMGDMKPSPWFVQGSNSCLKPKVVQAPAQGQTQDYGYDLFPDTTVNNKPGLVVRLSDAVLWLQKYNGSDRHADFIPINRYLMRYDNLPFAMISYNSALMRDPQGRADLLAMLLRLKEDDGYEYIWWDWLVIINPKPPMLSNYKQVRTETPNSPVPVPIFRF